jgi:tetratricopeptide (TPR) repeat protein
MDPATTSGRPSRRRLIVAALGLVGLVFAVYFPALSGEFVYDDLLVVQQNPRLESLANLPAAFTSSYWDFLEDGSAQHVGYYRPLTMVLLTVANVLGGGEPLAFHLLSLAVYAACCLAAWRFAVRLLKSELAGTWAALLFAVHPLHVESVAWISGLNDPLFALFGFLSLSAFLDWRDRGSAGRPWRAGLWFLLALLSKDAAVALVPAALAVDWGREPLQPTERRWSRAGLARAYGPLLAAFGVYYLARVVVFGDALAGFDRQTTDFGVGFVRLALLRLELLGGAVSLLAWPAEPNLFRPFHPELPVAELLAALVGTALLLVGIAVAWRKRARPALALLLFVPAALAPVLLRVESLGSFPVSDRFLFVPVLGFTGLLAWLACTRLPRGAALGLLGVALVAYIGRTVTHLPTWANEEALFRTALEQNPRNPTVHWSLGRVLLEDYQRTGLADPLIEARDTFERGMDLLEEAQSEEGADVFASRDDHLQMNLGLGWSLLFEAQVDPFHDYGTARKVFERVVAGWPDNERAYIGVGVAHMAQGDPNAAGEALRKALQLNPRSPEAHFNMGELYMRLQDWDAAAREFETCTTLRNNRLRDLVYWTRALLEGGRDARAEEIAQRAHALAPEDPGVMVLLGTIEARKERYDAALAWFDRALKLLPNLGEAHLQRGNVLTAMGHRGDAVLALKEACRILPDRFQAHYNLAVLLRASNQPEAAIPYFLVAYRLRRPEFDRIMKEAADTLHKGDIRILGSLASIDADRGDLPAARAWVEKALAVEPDDPANNFIQGVLLVKQEQLDDAYDPLRIAAEALPGNYQAQMEFSGLLLQLDRVFEAEPYLRRALVLIEEEPMEPGVKKLTRETIENTLSEIAKLKSQGPGAGGEGG